jgi:hypothetical protein
MMVYWFGGFVNSLWECLKSRANEIDEMSLVLRETPFEELSAIPSQAKELNGSPQGLSATGKAARPSAQAGKIVSQFSIIAFNGVSLTLVRHREVLGRPIDHGLIGFEQIAVIAARLGRLSQQGLQDLSGAFKDDAPAQNAACGTIHKGHEVDSVFLRPMKV